jgi:hypothetical protein
VTRWIAALLGPLLGGCVVDSSGFGGRSPTPSHASTGDASDPDASDADTGRASATGLGSSDGASTAAASTSGVSTSTDEASTGQEPASLCPEGRAELVACYDFAGVGRGTLWDRSGNGNDGEALGVGVVAGPFGDAATFDHDSRIAVPDSASLDLEGAHTLEAWLRLDALPTGGARAGVLDKEGQYSLILYDDGRYRCDSLAGTLFAGPAVLGAWTHVACVYDGTTLRFVVDGRVLGSTPASGPLATLDTDPMSIGDTSPDFDEPLTGAIGAVRVWSRALELAELCDAAGAACTG